MGLGLKSTVTVLKRNLLIKSLVRYKSTSFKINKMFILSKIMTSYTPFFILLRACYIVSRRDRIYDYGVESTTIIVITRKMNTWIPSLYSDSL